MSKPPPTPMDNVTAVPSESIAKPAPDCDMAESAKVADVAAAPPDDDHHVHVELPDDLADALETGGAGESTT